MADYKVIVTNTGLDKLEDALANGSTLVIKEMGFGDAYGEEYIPSATQLDLKHKIYSKDVTEAIAAEGVVKYKTTLLSTDPSGDFIELGLYLDDGSLFAVANIPKLEHRQSDSGSVTETEITLALAAENAQNVTIAISSDLYITKDYANTYYLRTDGNNLMTTNLSLANFKITELKTGTESTDATNVSQLLPVGSIYLYAGVSTPSNAKDCDGLSYSRLGEMATLYQVIGTLYGKGDGSMTFNVPNLTSPDPSNPNIRYVIKYKY
jgi:phage-related tail fiber protein